MADSDTVYDCWYEPIQDEQCLTKRVSDRTE